MLVYMARNLLDPSELHQLLREIHELRQQSQSLQRRSVAANARIDRISSHCRDLRWRSRRIIVHPWPRTTAVAA